MRSTGTSVRHAWVVQRRELVEFARGRGLRYPIRTKAEFVRQMGRGGETVTFRERIYDAGFATALIPDFFFPVDSEHDLVGKTMELLVARGLLPVPAGRDRGPGTHRRKAVGKCV